MIRQFNADERGVSEVIGAILVFGVLVALLAIIQAQAIPAANEKVEFNHNQELQADFVNFNTAMAEVGTQGTPKSVKIQMGTTYPSRLLFFNPGPPGGEIRSAGSGSVSIYNVDATDQDTKKYINGSIENLTSRRLEYDPTYNEYQDAPVTALEYGTVYRDFNDTTIIDDETNLVRGNTISLTLLNGNFTRGQSTALSLEAQATSAPARTVTIGENATMPGPIKLVFPSRLSVAQWDDMLSDEPHVQDVVSNGSRVEVRLDPTRKYNLRSPQIGVGSGVPEPNATYVTRSSNRLLQIDQANTLPIEVRDKYNNPVSGESVNISVDDGSFQGASPPVNRIEADTASDGRPAVNYFGGSAGVVLVNASYERQVYPNPDFDPENNPEDIRMLVRFDPRTDDVDPVIQDTTVNRTDYDVCTAFQNTDVLVDLVGLNGTTNTILTCLTTGDASVIVVDYEVSDSGGSGLDYIELGIKNASGGVILNKTHKLRGIQQEGRFFTPQIIHNDRGEPVEVEVRAFDRNTNEDNQTKPAA
jgi:FlaG/FlaF family flagellin (archaellin)